MVGNLIFLDKSIEANASSIVLEIMDYVNTQNKQGILNPYFYDSTLLLISEILPYMKDQEVWKELGYQICRRFKQSMETYGYQRQSTVFGGLFSKCFAVNSFCHRAGILKNFVRNIHQVLFFIINEQLKQFKIAPVRDSNHDMINGISGALYYLLDFDYGPEEKQTLIKCIEYLISLTSDKEFNGKKIIRFHVLQPDQNPNLNQEEFKLGNINFGLAHGMLGPLIALAKAHNKGFYVNGLQEGIEKIYQLYEIFQLKNEGGVPSWPGTMTVEEYWNGACKKEHLHSCSSWCYGNAGGIRGLQKVATYMGWKEKEHIYIEAMKRLYAQEIKNYNLFSPSVCHGFSSLVAIQTCSYAAYKDPGLLINLERNVRHLIEEYRRSNEREMSLTDIYNGTTWTEGYLKDLSLLTGSSGVAITLLSLKGPIQMGKLLMID